jgi:acyl-ACP thioesterase
MSAMIEFVPRPDRGRRFRQERRVQLGDAGPDGVLRLDGVVRFLQDVATEDWIDSGLSRDGTWVVRRTVLRIAASGRWPNLYEDVTLVTWCGGTGAAWAERRTDLEVDGAVLLETVSLWVPVDGRGRPMRIREPFHDLYGEASGGRRVPGRVPPAPAPTSPDARAWPVRRADLDVVGHVNNAAIWAALVEVSGGTVSWASLTHHGPVEDGHVVSLLSEPGRMWLATDDAIRVSAEYGVA